MHEYNLKAIESLNQRGGRMLSIIDLIERQTIPVELAAYLFVAIQQHASIIIGAESGGAGKTTVMGALLGLLPQKEQIITIENANFIQQMHHGSSEQPITYIIHEIGTGSWYGYLWGEPIAQVMKFINNQTRIMSNLHPDTYLKVQTTFKKFGVLPQLFTKMDLLVFLSYDAENNHRYIRELWESNDDHHDCIYTSEHSFMKPMDQCRFYLSSGYNEMITKYHDCIKQKLYCLAEVHSFLFK